jgi:hypothetical protein
MSSFRRRSCREISSGFTVRDGSGFKSEGEIAIGRVTDQGRRRRGFVTVWSGARARSGGNPLWGGQLLFPLV